MKKKNKKVKFYNVLKINMGLKILFTKEFLFSYFKITLGVLLVSIGLYFFFGANDFITGGVGGIGIIINHYTNFNLSYFIYIANAILILIAYLFIGRTYVIKSLYASILLPSFILLFELVTKKNSIVLFDGTIGGHAIIGTSRYILTAVFGSVFSGAGLGITFNNNSSTGGMDIVQKIITKYLKVPFSVAIFATDGVVMAVGVFAFGLEKTLYAAISVFIIAKVVDYIIFSGKAGYTGFIITSQTEYLIKEIYRKLDRGITKVEVKGGYSKSKRDMIICTISKKQIHELEEIIEKVDPFSFSFIVQTREVVGYGFRKKED